MTGRRRSLAPLLPALLAGCLAAPARAEEGNVFSNLFKYGGTTVPPSQPKEVQAAYCPTVDVTEGGSALRTVAGAAVRTQISLGRLARECARREDGSIAVKVGVEARVLLGPAGAPGRFEVPLTILLKSSDKVFASRVARASAAIAPGEAQGFATFVVDDLVVPPAMSADYEIEVGLGARGAQPKAAAKAGAKVSRRKPAVAAAPPAGGEATGGDPAQ